MKKGRDRKK